MDSGDVRKFCLLIFGESKNSEVRVLVVGDVFRGIGCQISSPLASINL